jgi:hypothetical protein
MTYRDLDVSPARLGDASEEALRRLGEQLDSGNAA